MQHMKLCTPGESLRFTLSPGDNGPGGTSSGHSGARVNGIVPAGPPKASACSPFKTGKDPPPKFLTSVNVCTSPPWLVTSRFSPASTLKYEGSIRQAGWPTIVGLSGENKNARNC